jgi:hypothetical protein
MENVEILFDEAEILEAAIACELNTQEADAARIAAEIQIDIDASEKVIVHHYEIITAKHAEQEKRVAAVREEGRARLEELRRKLADAKHELAVINSPILTLPYEVTAEVFNWHLLMGGNLTTTLLVCKRWTMVGYSSPRLWSRIVVSDLRRDQLGLRPGQFHLQGAIRCSDLISLRLALSRAQSSPLQIEISFLPSFFGYITPVISRDSSQSTSFRDVHQAATNRIEGIKLIFDHQVLRRCAFLILRLDTIFFGDEGSPKAVTNVLPLLSSIHFYSFGIRDHTLPFIQSLIKFSPSLRHIRCDSNLGPQHLGVGMWAKRIESYGWIYPATPVHLLHGSPSLRDLAIRGEPTECLTLPALRLLRWSLTTYSGLHFVTAPHLHTLILSHPSLALVDRQPAGSVTFPYLREAIHINIPDLTVLLVFHTPALEYLSIQSTNSSPTALFELFDGSENMPAPKSLHLDCPFTDASLIAVLGRLPWLEELQIAGTIAQEAFWEELTPSSNPSWRVWLPKSYPDERATRILTPNLKILLINYSTGPLYNPPKFELTKRKRVTRKQRAETAQASEPLNQSERGGEWTVIRASTIAVAREEAGCPLKTLACKSPEQKVEVLLGSLDTLPQRPKCVLLTAS